MKQLVPPPSLGVLTIVGLFRGVVSRRKEWRGDTRFVLAWLKIDQAFATNPEGPWVFEEADLALLVASFRCLGDELPKLTDDEFRYLMMCVVALDRALASADIPPPPPEPPPAEPEATPPARRKLRRTR